MSDDVQTVQMDYAEAMEMLYRQQQTIKELRAENARLRDELEKANDNLTQAVLSGYMGRPIA